MNKQEYEAKRDELIENKSQFCQCNGIVCHGCESIIRKNLSIGFDFAWNLAQAEIEEMKKKHEDFCEQAQEKIKSIEEKLSVAKDALEFYAHGWLDTMPKESMSYGLRPFGERSRQALKEIEGVE